MYVLQCSILYITALSLLLKCVWKAHFMNKDFSVQSTFINWIELIFAKWEFHIIFSALSEGLSYKLSDFYFIWLKNRALIFACHIKSHLVTHLVHKSNSSQWKRLQGKQNWRQISLKNRTLPALSIIHFDALTLT